MGHADNVEVHGQPPGWPEVIAVFAAQTAAADNSGRMWQYWTRPGGAAADGVLDMTDYHPGRDHRTHGNRRGGGWTESILHITITPDADGMRVFYQFTDDQMRRWTSCWKTRSFWPRWRVT